MFPPDWLVVHVFRGFTWVSLTPYTSLNPFFGIALDRRIRSDPIGPDHLAKKTNAQFASTRFGLAYQLV
jgi:hypothetical protein